MHPILQALQFLSGTPLRVVSTTPGRASATGQVRGGLVAHLEQIAGLDPVGDLELAPVQLGGDWCVHRVDHLSAIVSCTGFGGLLVQQVRDVERYVELYLAGEPH